MMNIVKVTLPEKCRIICVSDIHAHYDEFARLLRKCDYNNESDYLFILGDILEKGRQNIETLHFIQKLSHDKKCVCIKGNNDTMVSRMAFDDEKEKFLERLTYRPVNAYMQMAESIGITNFTTDFDNKRNAVNEKFDGELSFITELPLAIETEKYIFVHAGVENRPDWENSSEQFVLCAPWWIRSGHALDKYVVVGHFPTYNFARGKNTNLPIIDNDKKIIDIDGGCSVKSAGQINAFIITKDGESYSYDNVFEPSESCEKCTVIKDYTAARHYSYLDYEKSDLEILGKSDGLVSVRDKHSGNSGLILENYIAQWGDGRFHGWTNLDAFVCVNKGETFCVYYKNEKYCYGIAQSGEVGMIPLDCVAVFKEKYV